MLGQLKASWLPRSAARARACHHAPPPRTGATASGAPRGTCTKLGKKMKAAGLEKDYRGSYNIWNPSQVNFQNMDCKEAGAQAAVKLLEKYGFKAYAGSRMD